MFFSDISSSTSGTISVALASSRRMRRISVSSLSFPTQSHHSSPSLLSTSEVYICGSCSLETGLRTASEYLHFPICTRVVVPPLSSLEHERRRKCHVFYPHLSVSFVCTLEPSKPSVLHALFVVDCPCIVPGPFVCALFILSARWTSFFFSPVVEQRSAIGGRGSKFQRGQTDVHTSDSIT